MPEATELEFERELQALGQRIKQLRLERGLSVRDLVIHHNFHDAQWRRYEKGGTLTILTLMRISKTLNTTLAALVGGVDELPLKKVKASRPRAMKR